MNKKILIPIVAVVLIAACAAGWFLIPRTPDQVPVYAFGMVGYTDYYVGGSESYGLVTCEQVQTIFLSDTQTVTGINVYQGQKVKAGDVLYTYDTTLSDLALERKDLSIQQMEMNQKTAQEELAKLKTMKPMYISGGSSTSTTVEKAPSSSSSLNTVYDGSGSSGDPFRYWLGQNAVVDENVIESLFDLMGGGSQVYVIFQQTKSNQPGAEFSAQYGVRYGRIVTNVEVTPTDPPGTEPPASEGPTEAPTEPPVQEPTEPSGPQEIPLAVASYRIGNQEIHYEMSFFDPGSKSDSPEINWNSGYTQNELNALINEKNAEIEQLKFDIKMAKAELAIMRKEAADGKICAEFDGVVASVLEPENARELGEPIVKVAGGGGFYVEGAISELDLKTIEVGQKVSVTSWENGTVYQGTVAEIGTYPSQDQDPLLGGGTNVTYYPYRVFIDESADLMEGTYVGLSYRAEAQSGGVLYLQNAFILTENNQSYAYVRNAEGLLEKRRLQVGVSQDGYYTPVYSGLDESAMIAFPYGDVTEGAPTYEGTSEELYGY